MELFNITIDYVQLTKKNIITAMVSDLKTQKDLVEIVDIETELHKTIVKTITDFSKISSQGFKLPNICKK
jgi:hypothetical protein